VTFGVHFIYSVTSVSRRVMKQRLRPLFLFPKKACFTGFTDITEEYHLLQKREVTCRTKQSVSPKTPTRSQKVHISLDAAIRLDSEIAVEPQRLLLGLGIAPRQRESAPSSLSEPMSVRTAQAGTSAPARIARLRPSSWRPNLCGMTPRPRTNSATPSQT
jgi:hypothetical protein